MEEVELPTKQIIERYVSKGGDDERHKPVPNRYHASQAWKCFRQQFYDRNGVKKEKELPHGLFEMGRRAEDVVEAALRKYYHWRYVRNNIPIHIDLDNYEIVGETDPVLIGDNFVLRRIYEVKSSESRYQNTMTKDAHKHQYAVYHKALNPTEPGRIVHPGRSDLLRNMPDEDYLVTQEEAEKLWRECKWWFDEFHAYIEKDALPPAKPITGDECKWCPFMQRCRSDGGWKPHGNGMTRIEKPYTE